LAEWKAQFRIAARIRDDTQRRRGTTAFLVDKKLTAHQDRHRTMIRESELEKVLEQF
jgi:hypothetical protein